MPLKMLNSILFQTFMVLISAMLEYMDTAYFQCVCGIKRSFIVKKCGCTTYICNAATISFSLLKIKKIVKYFVFFGAVKEITKSVLFEAVKQITRSK